MVFAATFLQFVVHTSRYLCKLMTTSQRFVQGYKITAVDIKTLRNLMHFFLKFLLEGSNEAILGLLDNKCLSQMSCMVTAACKFFRLQQNCYDIAMEFTATFIKKYQWI